MDNIIKVIAGLIIAVVFIGFAWLQIKLAILLFPITIIIIVIAVFAGIFQSK